MHLPPSYADSSLRRFPVLFMPDGGVDEDFPHVVRTVDSLMAAGAIRPVIVVGVPNTQRRRDMTGPTRFAADSAIAPRVGGSADFRAFIRDELIPAVAARYRVTDERAIIGESLAGLFIVELFLAEPTLFTHAIALDPGLWWDEGSLVDSARSRLGSLPPSIEMKRTLHLANSDEKEIADDVARLVEIMRRVAPAGVAWTHVSRDDVTHGTIYRMLGPPALARALK